MIDDNYHPKRPWQPVKIDLDPAPDTCIADVVLNFATSCFEQQKVIACSVAVEPIVQNKERVSRVSAKSGACFEAYIQ